MKWLALFLASIWWAVLAFVALLILLAIYAVEFWSGRKRRQCSRAKLFGGLVSSRQFRRLH